MPAPVFGNNLRIIAEQPDTVYLGSFLVKEQFDSTFAWQTGFTAPPGVTLNSDGTSLNVANNISDTYKETALKLTATAADGTTTDATLTLVTLTPKMKLAALQNDATDYRQRIFIEGVDISDRVEGSLSFTNQIDAEFLNKFTISGFNLTLSNHDGIFDFLSPRNFFAKHGQVPSGKGAGVRIAMGFWTAEHGEVTRTIFKGIITQTTFTRNKTIIATVVNLNTELINTSANQNRLLEIPITITPDVNVYDIAGDRAWNRYYAVPNSLQGGQTRLVNQITASSAPYDAIQSNTTIQYGQSRPAGSDFIARYTVPMIGYERDDFANFLSVNHIPNFFQQQQQQQQQQLVADNILRDASFNLQTGTKGTRHWINFGTPASLLINGDTLFGITGNNGYNSNYDDAGNRIFSYNLLTRRYTQLLYRAGRAYLYSQLKRRSDTEFYCVLFNNLLTSQFKSESSQLSHSVIKLTLDAQGNPSRLNELTDLTHSTGNIRKTLLARSNLVFKDNTLSMLCTRYLALHRQYQVNVIQRNVTDAAGVYSFAHGPVWNQPAGRAGGQQVLPEYGDGVGWSSNSNPTTGNVSLDREDYAIWYSLSDGVYVKETTDALPFKLYTSLTERLAVTDGVDWADSLLGRQLFKIGSRLYERTTRTGHARDTYSAGGYFCRLVYAAPANAQLSNPWLWHGRLHVIVTPQPADWTNPSTAPSEIHRLETGGTTTRIDTFPVFDTPNTRFNGRWIAFTTPVFHQNQNQPIFYAAYQTGQNDYRGNAKSFVRYSTDVPKYRVISTVTAKESLFDIFNQKAIDENAYWYFDVERLYFRQRQHRQNAMLSAWDAATNTLRYTEAIAIENRAASGQVLLGDEVLTYTGIGTVTEDDVTYQTLTGVTRGIDATNTRLLTGSAFYPVADVLTDFGYGAAVLNSVFQTKVTNTIEKLQLRPLQGDERVERLPVQVTPGEKITQLDVNYASTDERALSNLEASYKAYYEHNAVFITLTCKPRYTVNIGDVVYLQLKRHQFRSLAQITSITYEKSEFTLKLRSLATPPVQSYPYGGNTQRGIAYDFETDRLYVNRTENGVVWYHETNVVTGELASDAYWVELHDVRGVGRGGNAAIHGRYLYMKNAQRGLQRINRLDLATFQMSSPWQWLPTPAFSGVDDTLVVDAEGSLWAREGTTILTQLVPNAAPSSTNVMTRTTPASFILIPTELQGTPRFTYWQSLFWGVDRTGDAPVLKGFRKKTDGTTEVTRTLTLPANLFTGQRFCAFTRGRHGWYFLTRNNLYFIADSESGFDPGE